MLGLAQSLLHTPVLSELSQGNLCHVRSKEAAFSYHSVGLLRGGQLVERPGGLLKFSH